MPSMGRWVAREEERNEGPLAAEKACSSIMRGPSGHGCRHAIHNVSIERCSMTNLTQAVVLLPAELYATYLQLERGEGICEGQRKGRGQTRYIACNPEPLPSSNHLQHLVHAHPLTSTSFCYMHLPVTRYSRQIVAPIEAVPDHCCCWSTTENELTHALLLLLLWGDQRYH
jgi:hypothetical protein